MTPRMEDFFREMAVALATQGHARLYEVTADGRSVAALLAFVSGDELLLYNSGYDPEYAHASVGLVSKAMAMQRSVEDGLTVFDFLRGAEPYKYDLGGQDRIVRQLWVRRGQGAIPGGSDDV
jgi:CelD/BcsL family acetyltransferase involved in cellulose biosynthesis